MTYSPHPLIVTVSYDPSAPLGRQWLAECGSGDQMLSAAAYSPAGALTSLAVTMNHQLQTLTALTGYTEPK